MDTKILYPSTKVLLINGTEKKASELEIGDTLLAPNQEGRTILEISQCKSNNYMIIPRYCNSSFIISDAHLFPIVYDTQTYLIDIETFKKQELKQFFSLVHEGIEFIPSFVTLEPYFLGLWLCNHNSLTFEKKNAKTFVFIMHFIEKFSLQHEGNEEHITLVDSRLITQFEKYDLIAHPRIPDEYKYNSANIRSRLLTGVMDFSHETTNQIELLTKQQATDFCFLIHSLGYLSLTKKKNQSYFVSVIYNNTSQINDFKVAKIDDDNGICMRLSGSTPTGIFLNDFTVI
jgi:hypothetical protein